MRRILWLTLCLGPLIASAQNNADTLLAFIQANYTKIERRIPMRDGVKLFTAIYIPHDTTEDHAFMMMRTPYSCAPYGENSFPRRLGPSRFFPREKYIFVVQDVRGRYMSEGQFQEMTPAIDNKRNKKDVDESSDTYDTIDWLLKNIDHNSGKVGIYGISYPGFYASASLPGAHPAIKAVSPQAPVTDEFVGDDANHRGAFFLLDNFDFMNFFDHPRPEPWMKYPSMFDVKYDDAYDFFLKLGPVKNANDLYFKNQSKIWNEYLEHPTYDSYWRARNIRPHLKGITPAVLVVGGWFDAEDQFGALKTFEAANKQNPGADIHLLMGPWTHGAWARGEWSHYADYAFGANTSAYFQQLELDFFNFYLKGTGKPDLDKATVFVTGSNEWRKFTAWPPDESTPQTWYMGSSHTLSTDKPMIPSSYDTYVSDPAHPVPYINGVKSGRDNNYMGADQRFAALRPDVLTYTSDVLSSDMTLTGEIDVDLYASITGTDADFIVKVIDVLPLEPQGAAAPSTEEKALGGYEQLVRAEVMRGKFRKSWEHPEPFDPGSPTRVSFALNSIAHTFKAGHRLMVQVQSSWFPLVDLNPQTFVDIPQAKPGDFKTATIKLYHDTKHPSSITVRKLP
ncbi:CocE/NonD family hydrolase [Dinghuibacter silviterrae]|nr:CocE/NonD family hydrolase [Dinghuibacter silviterrae]